MIKRAVGEFLGTFFLVFCGTGAIIINQETHGAITHLGIAITFGLIVMAMIVTFGHISGAHINPAVTIALCVSNKFKVSNIPIYIISQIGGGISASTVLHFLFPKNDMLGTTLPSGSVLQSFILEFILTFLLMIVILMSSQKNKSLLIPSLAIGGTVGLEAMFAGPICGASMNPARSIAPALISSHFHSLWVYIIAPISGAFFAAIIYLAMKKPVRQMVPHS